MTGFAKFSVLHRAFVHRVARAVAGKAPDGYRHFDARDKGWTKVVLKPAA